MGATATALEGILYYAPGEPLPRRRFAWAADGTMTLVPLEEEEPPAGDGQPAGGYVNGAAHDS